MVRNGAGRPRLWAFCSGKGGVGKSVIAASLAQAAAERGRRCVLVDADLGAANLHTLLGIRRPHAGLAHFLNGEVEDLDRVLAPTATPNLHLVNGACSLVGAADGRASERARLLRGLRRLDVDHVLLDLGAGCAMPVLDLFLAASERIVVVAPEPTSVENAYGFLKAAFYRSLRRATRHPRVRKVLRETIETKGRRHLRSPLELIAGVREMDPEAGAALQHTARAFVPSLLVNQASTVDHRRLGSDIGAACRLHLGTTLRHVGTLGWDENVREAVRRRTPVLSAFPSCSFAIDVVRLAQQLFEQSPTERARTLRADESPRRRSLFSERPLAREGLVPLDATPAPQPLPALGTSEPGPYLRRCRELRGFSEAEFEQATRIHILAALEEQRFDRLPPEPYVRGYVLQLARALDVPDPEAVLAGYLDRYRAAHQRVSA